MQVQVQAIKLTPRFTSWDEFDINQYTIFNYYSNRYSTNIRYYHCSQYRKIEGCSVKAKAEVQDDLRTILVTETGFHNHSPTTKKVSKETKNMMKNLIISNPSLPPSKLHLKFLEEREEKDSKQVKPTLGQFQNAKKVLNSVNDKTRTIIEKFGTEFPSSFQYVQLFSLNPYCIILSLSTSRNHFEKKKMVLFVDDTHEMLNPSSFLMCVMGLVKDKGKHFYLINNFD